MPLFFLVLGLILISSGLHDHAGDLAHQFASDMSGFLPFATAILIVGGLGMIESFRPVSKALLILIFAVFFLKNGNQLTQNLTASVTKP